MRSILLALSLAFAVAPAACGNGSKGPTTPTIPVPPGPVTAESMTTYFEARFAAQVADGSLQTDFGSAGVSDDVIKELAALGITDMKGVAALVPADFDTKGWNAIKASNAPSTTIAGLMRDLMIIKDTRGYFTKAWNNSWVTNGPEDFPAPAAYGVDFKVMEELGVFGAGSEEGDGAWEGGDEGVE